MNHGRDLKAWFYEGRMRVWTGRWVGGWGVLWVEGGVGGWDCPTPGRRL